MGSNRIAVRRKSLYDEVWSEPVRTVAKKYGISDVGLAKICRRHKIPLPGVGYWQKKEAGHAVEKAPLPEYEGAQEIEIYRWTYDHPPPDEAQNAEAEKMIAFEEDPQNRIAVPDILTEPHPLVSRTQTAFKNATKDEWERLVPRAKRCLDVALREEFVDRSLRILDALIKALGARQVPVYLEKEGERVTRVDVLGETLGIRCEEIAKRKMHKLSPAEKKKVEKNPFTFDIPRYDFVSTGCLALVITDKTIRGTRLHWSDTKRKKLEDRLNDFVIGLFRAAVSKRAQRLESERRQREWKERERARQKRDILIFEERQRLEQLDREVEAWYKARRIRQYIAAVRDAVTQKRIEIEPGSKLDQWLQWAKDQADRYDPLVKSPPSGLT